MLPTARVSDVKEAHFYRDHETEMVRQIRLAAKQLRASTFK
jgi:hypothetical protein